MACDFLYKGQTFTKKQLEQYLKDNPQEVNEILTSLGHNQQFQKLTAEEKVKTIEQVTKEHRSITALKDLAAKLAYRIGGKVEFENRTDVDWKGYNQDMKSVLNEAYMTPDTPFHEILAHPIIKAIKSNKHLLSILDYSVLDDNGFFVQKVGKTIAKFPTREQAQKYIDENSKDSELYQSLLKELETGRGKEVFEQVKRDYAYKNINDISQIFKRSDLNKYQLNIFKDNKNTNSPLYFDTIEQAEQYFEKYKKEKYTLEEQQEEAIVTLLGLMAADKLDAKKDATLISKLKELWKQISDFVKSLLKQDGIKIDELPISTTLNDLAEIMAYGNNKIILPGYKVEYSTPLGNKYDTLEEVNNEIRGLAEANVEVDLSGVKINYKKITDSNELPTQFSVLINDEPYSYSYENNQWNLYYHIGGKQLEKSDVKIDKVIQDYNNYNLNSNINNFIEKNKEYEQSREIIEQWKKENNIQYDPEEVYSRGQGFYSSIGAYSNLELDLLFQNLLQHIQDNKKASQPNVILPIGTSGSGKSTFIKSLPQENLVIIEPDAMRVEFTGDMNNKSKDKEIYIEAAKRAAQAIKQGKQVVFDTTNLTKDKRLPFIEAIKKAIPTANIQYKLMELNPELAKQRIKAQLERGENRANVPDSTIDRHAESYKQMLEDIKNEPITPYGSNYGFTISAFTKPIDKRLKHIEGSGDRVRFVIYPKSEHIKWAAPTDVYSGSVWDAHEKVSKDKKSELLGVSFTKAPALRNINEVSPNLADIIDNLSHVHNELGIELTTNNFRIEYDDNIDYSIKKLIDNINKILDDKYGKLAKSEISTNIKNYQIKYGTKTENFDLKEDAEKRKYELWNNYDEVVQIKEVISKQPTQTRDNTTSIESVKNNLNIVGEKRNRGTYDEIDKGTIVTVEGQNGEYYVESVSDSDGEIGVGITNLFYDLYPVDEFDPDTNPNGQHPLFNVPEKVIKIKEGVKKEYTSQAEINLKVAALKEVARKYPRSLITSKVVPINPNIMDNSEIQYSKVSSKSTVKNFNNITEKLEQTLEEVEKAQKMWYSKNPKVGGLWNKEQKERNKEFRDTINELNETIQTLNTQDKEEVYNFIKQELQELEDSIINYKSESIKNVLLGERLNFLSSYILGNDLDGATTNKWDLSDFENYQQELIEPLVNLINLREDFLNNQVLEILENSPILREYARSEGVQYEDLKDFFLSEGNKRLKDISFTQQWFLGINQNDSSIYAAALQDLYESMIATARNPIVDLSHKISELNESLKKAGYDFENFKNGLELRTLYTTKFREQEQEINRLKSRFYKLKFNEEEGPEKAKVYSEMMGLLKSHTDMIDYSSLQELHDLYENHPIIGKYFDKDLSKRNEYSSNIKKTLGKEYDTIIANSIAKIEDYLDSAVSIESKGDLKEFENYQAQYSPFEFINHYYSSDYSKATQVRTNTYRYNLGEYSNYIPKKSITNLVDNTTEDTGYYDTQFIDKVMSNNDAFEMFKLLIDAYTNHINPIYGISNALSYGKLKSEVIEIIKSNYNSGKGWVKIGKALKESGIADFYVSRSAGDPKKLVNNYSDDSNKKINLRVKTLIPNGIEYVKTQARKLGISDSNSNIEQLAREVATQEYLNQISPDLIRNTVALLELSSIQRARVEGAASAELLLSKHTQMKNEYDQSGARDKDNAKISNWVSANFYGTLTGSKDVEMKFLGKKLEEVDKKIKETLESLYDNVKSGQDYKFNINGVTYLKVGRVYQRKSEEGKLTAIKEDEFFSNLETYIDKTIASLGIPMTTDSFVNGIISNMVKKTFWFSPVSGLFNRLEGKFTNWINDLSGYYWTTGNIRIAEKMLNLMFTKNFTRANKIFKEKQQQLDTLALLVEEMNVLQDRKNEIEKKDKQSTFGKLKDKFDFYRWAITNPEYKNQTSIVIAMLADVEVKDNEGNIHKFVTEKGEFALYEPGTLNVKPEFAKYNKNWQEFKIIKESQATKENSNQYYITKRRISDAIAQLQGNYNNLDSTMYRNQKGVGGLVWGKILGLYMRWFPSHANQRLGKRDLDYVQGKKNQVGRLRYAISKPLIGGAFLSTVSLLTLGPGAILTAIPFGLGVMKTIYTKAILKKDINNQVSDIKLLAGFLQETLMRTIGFPIRFASKYDIDGKIMNSKWALGKLSDTEQGAIKALAQELAIAINVLLFTIILKSLLHGGAGDDEDEKMLHNFIDNQGNRLLQNISIWTNPKQLIEQNSQFALVRTVNDIYRIFDDFSKLIQGDDFDGRRPVSKILQIQPFIPIPNVLTRALVKGEYPGMDEREYQNSQWFDRYTKPQEWRDEKKYENLRREYKDYREPYIKLEIERENPNLSESEIQKEFERKIRSEMNKKDMKRGKGESYEDALKRINLDTDNIK